MSSPPRTYDASQSERRLRLQGLPLASFRRRAAALLLDFFFASLLFALLFFLLFLVLHVHRLLPKTPWVWKLLGFLTGDHEAHGENLNVRFGFYNNAMSVIWLVGYFSLAHYWGRGRSLGKRALGIRVLSLDHEHLSLWHCVERALGYGASALEAGSGFFQYFFDRNRRTVHDRICETIVVRERREKRAPEASPREGPSPDPRTAS